MDLTLFIIFVIMIISFLYFIKAIYSLQNEIISLKTTCKFNNNNKEIKKENNNKELLNKLKEIFMNYIRK